MKIKWSLKTLFVGWFAIMLVILILVFPEDRPIRIDEVRFQMPENEELYFKNVRSFYYELEERKDAGFKLYRIKSRSTDSIGPGFTVAIAQNWRLDEAYVLIEPKSAWAKPDTLTLAVTNDQESDTLQISSWNNANHYLFAAHLYMALRDTENNYALANGDNWEPILTKGDERSSLKKTLKDYFKLVGKMP